MKAKEFIPASKPRNFVAKNQQTAGAGAHRDKKKEQKQGYEKHKGRGVAEGHTTEKQIMTRIRQIMHDRKLSGTESNAGELHRLKQQLKDLRSQQNVAEGIGGMIAGGVGQFLGNKIDPLAGEIMRSHGEIAGRKAEYTIRKYMHLLQKALKQQLDSGEKEGVAEGDYPDGSSIKTPDVDEWKQQYQQAVMAVKNAKTKQEYEAASDRAGRIKDLLASKGIKVGPALGQQDVEEGSDWGEPREILEDVLQTLEREVEWPLTEVMDPKEVRQLLAPIVRAVNDKMMSMDRDGNQQDVEEGIPQPGPSSGAPKQFGPDADIQTRQMTVKEIISSIPGVPYYNNVVDDWDAKDYSWGVTKKVIEYATYLKNHPESLSKLPPIIVLNGKFEDGAHRVSAIWLLQQRMDPKNPLWKSAKLNIQFVKQGVAEAKQKGVDDKASSKMYDWLMYHGSGYADSREPNDEMLGNKLLGLAYHLDKGNKSFKDVEDWIFANIKQGHHLRAEYLKNFARSNIDKPMSEQDDWGGMSHREFKRRELQHELGHEDDPEFQRQMREKDRGPWYIKIDGKIYKQKGQPKMFDWKKAANNYALAMLKNRPELKGKTVLTRKPVDESIAEAKKKISAKDDPCWKGYKMVGTKKKGGREVPNCVPGKKGD